MPSADQFWDSIADEWRTRVRRSDEQIVPFIAALGCAPGSLVLDAGCGAGTIGVPLAARGYRVRGVDRSPRMIANARAVASESRLADADAQFAVADVQRLPFPDAAFDAMICVNVLDFAPQPGAALREFRRVLKPGARLILVMLGAYSPVKRDWWRRFLSDGDEGRVRSHILPWEMERLLPALGWRIIAQDGVFGRTFAGATSEYSQEMSDQLNDRVLQQTIAASWRFVAETTPQPPSLKGRGSEAV